jgi:hypothetical protein
MEIVIIDNQATKLCIDTNHPHHTKVRDAVEYHAMQINKLIQESVFENRIKMAIYNTASASMSLETFVLCEKDECKGDLQNNVN